ncbi:guanine nucleotide-binding protein alpha-2 subunit [Zychaea mexicana]|uniref:guanine nucleotide-binding protein alpha-2 subunit n=1 Tax=Zychaea mexicana TaxID=64656 RepID=UPI0022FF37A9|nr:guanine nucleotide-binding protein alpha-2 subunit [Zychaea mexicana]KAI9491631.1 guanine nucleotide-binding protein alpha-2 subunit [Zychaea mexicana]
MGSCCSKTPEKSTGGENDQNRSIERQIKTDEKRMKTEVKLLLLGAGESGKSTVLKQMKLINASGFDASERESFRMIVFSNVINIMQTLLEVIDQLNIPLELETSQEDAELIMQDTPALSKAQPYPATYLDPLKRLWSDPGIQKACKHGNDFALHDNVLYFYEELDRLWEEHYIPTDKDIIRCRAKTTGIAESIFHLGPLTYRMLDVGGQRSERKKWIHCFENVTAILFVVAISGYDQCLVEDRDSNQMLEALMLFDSICNSQWFVKTSMILFLNKIDIFKKKIKESPISKYFPDYKGPDDDFEQARTYFKKRFQRLNRNSEKRVYAYFTDATDTDLLQHVMTAVSDIILNENLNTFIL